MNLRTILSCILVLLNVVLLTAQEFGSADSHWVFNRDGKIGFTEVFFEKDTIIENKVFNKFLRREFVIVFGDTTDFVFGPLFLNNTDGLVLHSIDGEIKDTLINYNASPGDSWTITDYRGIDENFKVNVKDTFTTSFAGVDYKALSCIIHREDGVVGTFRDTIYEHWGFRHHYILPYDAYDVGAGNNRGGIILCFSNNALGTVEISPDPALYFGSVFPFDCDRLTSTEEIDVSDSYRTLSLYPNPVTDILHVLEVDIGAPYEIWDISGQTQMSGDFSLDNSIEVATLSKGIYFLRVGDMVRKFVKVE